ncbi:MAG: di-trans,poly-cis-decaprenylcistransferase [Candidatus Yonathbacteria bacterium]|nr:di-trans,poly-cis-decaprenylcistransferase [Candidatus Yonathbacteria bacterium]
MTETVTSAPKTVGIILDGNRRWAKEQGLPKIEGHRKGAENLQTCIGWARDAGVETLIVYGFSTENWNRTEEEVSGFMELIAFFAESIKARAIDAGTHVRFIGKLDMLPARTREKIDALEAETAGGTVITLVVALSYGGRAEILNAIGRLSEEDRATLTEESFGAKLWTAGLPDPDLIIRTGGQQRLSNFLPWQSVYSELFFTPTFWPAFTQEEFNSILAAYGTRLINKGK